jgi:hypothetical protein
MVNYPEMDAPLLGMVWLKRPRRFEVVNAQCRLELPDTQASRTPRDFDEVARESLGLFASLRGAIELCDMSRRFAEPFGVQLPIPCQIP